MASDCNLCNRLRGCGNNQTQEEWRRLVALLLCDMRDADEAVAAAIGGTQAFVPLPITRIAAAAVPAAYPGAAQLVDANDKTYVSIANYTNETVVVSTDGATDEFVLVSGSAMVLRSGDLNRVFPFSVFVRYDTVLPNNGEVVIEAGY